MAQVNLGQVRDSIIAVDRVSGTGAPGTTDVYRIKTECHPNGSIEVGGQTRYFDFSVHQGKDAVYHVIQLEDVSEQEITQETADQVVADPYSVVFTVAGRYYWLFEKDGNRYTYGRIETAEAGRNDVRIDYIDVFVSHMEAHQGHKRVGNRVIELYNLGSGDFDAEDRDVVYDNPENVILIADGHVLFCTEDNIVDGDTLEKEIVFSSNIDEDGRFVKVTATAPQSGTITYIGENKKLAKQTVLDFTGAASASLTSAQYDSLLNDNENVLIKTASGYCRLSTANAFGNYKIYTYASPIIERNNKHQYYKVSITLDTSDSIGSYTSDWVALGAIVISLAYASSGSITAENAQIIRDNAENVVIAMRETYYTLDNVNGDVYTFTNVHPINDGERIEVEYVEIDTSSSRTYHHGNAVAGNMIIEYASASGAIGDEKSILYSYPDDVVIKYNGNFLYYTSIVVTGGTDKTLTYRSPVDANGDYYEAVLNVPQMSAGSYAISQVSIPTGDHVLQLALSGSSGSITSAQAQEITATAPYIRIYTGNSYYSLARVLGNIYKFVMVSDDGYASHCYASVLNIDVSNLSWAKASEVLDVTTITLSATSGSTNYEQNGLISGFPENIVIGYDSHILHYTYSGASTFSQGANARFYRSIPDGAGKFYEAEITYVSSGTGSYRVSEKNTDEIAVHFGSTSGSLTADQYNLFLNYAKDIVVYESTTSDEGRVCYLSNTTGGGPILVFAYTSSIYESVNVKKYVQYHIELNTSASTGTYSKNVVDVLEGAIELTSAVSGTLTLAQHNVVVNLKEHASIARLGQYYHLSNVSSGVYTFVNVQDDGTNKQFNFITIDTSDDSWSFASDNVDVDYSAISVGGASSGTLSSANLAKAVALKDNVRLVNQSDYYQLFQINGTTYTYVSVVNVNGGNVQRIITLDSSNGNWTKAVANVGTFLIPLASTSGTIGTSDYYYYVNRAPQMAVLVYNGNVVLHYNGTDAQDNLVYRSIPDENGSFYECVLTSGTVSYSYSLTAKTVAVGANYVISVISGSNVLSADDLATLNAHMNDVIAKDSTVVYQFVNKNGNNVRFASSSMEGSSGLVVYYEVSIDSSNGQFTKSMVLLGAKNIAVSASGTLAYDADLKGLHEKAVLTYNNFNLYFVSDDGTTIVYRSPVAEDGYFFEFSSNVPASYPTTYAYTVAQKMIACNKVISVTNNTILPLEDRNYIASHPESAVLSSSGIYCYYRYQNGGFYIFNSSPLDDGSFLEIRVVYDANVAQYAAGLVLVKTKELNNARYFAASAGGMSGSLTAAEYALVKDNYQNIVFSANTTTAGRGVQCYYSAYSPSDVPSVPSYVSYRSGTLLDLNDNSYYYYEVQVELISSSSTGSYAVTKQTISQPLTNAEIETILA